MVQRIEDTGPGRWRWRWLRRAVVATSITVGIVAATGQSADAQASPASPARPAVPGPDAGAAPSWVGALTFPAQPDPPAAPPGDVIGPLAQQVITAQNDAERLGELLKSIADEQSAAQAVTAPLRDADDQAQTQVRDLEARAAAVTSEAYQDAVALGPFSGYADDLQDLGLLAPGLPVQVPEAARPLERDSIAIQLDRARQKAAATKAALDAAVGAESEINGRYAVVSEQFQRAQSALTVLTGRNASMLGTLGALRDTYEDSLTASRGLATSVNGLHAAASAQAAVAFALRQRGKPYVWAAEGPDAFDCSGLVLASYRSVGISLPRVSRDQYRYGGGMPVLVSQLLPGDLLFFSADRSDPSKIHHVAIYLGNGRMVHAPTFGETVKVSPIWWSEYFGAVRVVPALGIPEVPTTGRSPSPSPTPSPAASPSVSASPSASPSLSASPSASPPVSPSASPSASPGPSASASPTPRASPTPSTSPGPSASPSPTTSPASGVTGQPSASSTAAASRTPTPSPTSADGTPSRTSSTVSATTGSAVPAAVLTGGAVAARRSRRSLRRRRDRRR